MRSTVPLVLALACVPTVTTKDTPTGDSSTTSLGTLPAGQCRTVADCVGDPDCIEPDWDPPCGEYTGTVTPPCSEEGAACLDGGVCDATRGPCGATHYSCVPACTADGDCPTDEKCRPSGACTPAACADAEFTCAGDQVCDPTTGDAHGCAHLACASDASCDSGEYCVNGRCFASPGTCGEKLYPP